MAGDAFTANGRVMSVAVPSVGVVLPLYNAARYVAEAVDSVLAAANGAVARIVAVDDGSDDDGLKIACARSHLVQGVRIDHAGLSAARNHGVALLDTDLLAFIDADDLWPADALAPRLAVLAGSPEVDGVYGRVDQFICPSVPEERRARLRFATSDRPSPMITALLLRRTRFLDVGPFQPEVGNGENLDWQLRARAAGLAMTGIDTVVLRRRIHGDNLSLRNANAGLDYVRVLRAHLARGRGA